MTVQPTMSRVMGDGIAIQLACWEGEGKAILCVHGLTANCRCWDGIAGALSPRHRILAMDLRGRGLSGRPAGGYDINHHCLDIQALIRSLQLDSVVLMGHSLGAFISLAFAANYPQHVERIILVDGGGKLSPEQMGKVMNGIRLSIERLGKVFPSQEAYHDSLKQSSFFQPWTPVTEAYFRYETEAAEGGIRSRVLPGVIEEEMFNLKQFDAAALYPRVRCPVLILRAEKGMTAEDDILLPADVVERMLQQIPDARCIDLPDTNHYSILFQSHGERDRAILQFIEQSGQKRP